MENSLEKLEQRIDPKVKAATELIVKDSEGIALARNMVQDIRRLKKEIEDTFDPIIQKAYQAHKEAVAQKKRYIEPLDKAEAIIRQKITDCVTEIERRQREEAEKERRAREQALERERKRLDKLCEKAVSLYQELEIIENELKREGLSEIEIAALEARRNAVLARIQQSDEQIIEKQAAIQEKASEPVTAVLGPAVKLAGFSIIEDKEVIIVNAMALIKSVAEGKTPVSIITFDMKAIKKLVTAGMTLPGVAVQTKKSLRVKGE